MKKFVEEIRVDNLKRLVTEHKSLHAVAEKLGKDDSQVSQWLNRSPNSGTGKPRNISSKSARAIEDAFSKPVGWMDTPEKSLFEPQSYAAINRQDEPGVTEPLVVKIEMGKPGVSMAGLELAKEFDRIPTGDESAWMQAYQHILQTIVLLQSNPKAKPLLAQSPETQRAAPPAPPL